jgi:membrane protein required for colicin V production
MIMIFDIAIFVMLGYAAWKGWRNGFIMEIFYLLFIFVAIYLSLHFSDWFASKWGGPQPNGSGLKAFLICGLLFAVLLFFIAKLVSVAIKSGGGSNVNAFAGAFFAVFKTLLVLSVLLVAGEKINGKVKWMPREQREMSWTYDPLYRFSFMLLPAIEESALYHNGMRKAKEEWDDGTNKIKEKY